MASLVAYSKAESLPITLHEWLTAAVDVFLTRFIPVVDCSLQLVNAVFQTDLPPPDCKIRKRKQAGVPTAVIDHLGLMLDEQAKLRKERRSRSRTSFLSRTQMHVRFLTSLLGNGPPANHSVAAANFHTLIPTIRYRAPIPQPFLAAQPRGRGRARKPAGLRTPAAAFGPQNVNKSSYLQQS